MSMPMGGAMGGPMGSLPQMGGGPGPMSNNMQAVQGLPAMGPGGGGGGGPSAEAPPGYFQGQVSGNGGGGQDSMPGNPYLQQQQQQQQQQYLAAVMNQQRSMGNERFQPMMYARPPPAVNYMPPQPQPHQQHPYPYPYPYPPQYPPHNGDQYSDYFNDENTSSCNIM